MTILDLRKEVDSFFSRDHSLKIRELAELVEAIKD